MLVISEIKSISELKLYRVFPYKRKSIHAIDKINTTQCYFQVDDTLLLNE